LPTLKEKKRYIVFEIVSKTKFKDSKAIEEQIIDSSLKLIGQLGVAKAGIQPISFNEESQRGIIRVGHKYTDELKTSLTFIKQINNKDVIVNSISTSGILNKAKCQL
jgi:RNase P/RNase MRP subunit POP5